MPTHTSGNRSLTCGNRSGTCWIRNLGAGNGSQTLGIQNPYGDTLLREHERRPPKEITSEASRCLRSRPTAYTSGFENNVSGNDSRTLGFKSWLVGFKSGLLGIDPWVLGIKIVLGNENKKLGMKTKRWEWKPDIGNENHTCREYASGHNTTNNYPKWDFSMI